MYLILDLLYIIHEILIFTGNLIKTYWGGKWFYILNYNGPATYINIKPKKFSWFRKFQKYLKKH